MLDEKTICNKVTKCLDLLEEALKTKNLDASAMAHYLHEIRTDAQQMENGLRARAKAMFEAGIEESYQKEKEKKIKATRDQ